MGNGGRLGRQVNGSSEGKGDKGLLKGRRGKKGRVWGGDGSSEGTGYQGL